MSGNHFLLSLTDFSRAVEPNPSYPTEYDSFKFKADWEYETVEVTADAAGTEGRLPYSSDPANPYNNTGQQDPDEYTDVPVYIDGAEYLARNIKYEDTGNQAPYYTAGGGTNIMFVTFADGARVYIPGAFTFAIVRPASGGSEELLIEFNEQFMTNLGAQMIEHGVIAEIETGYTAQDGSFPLNGGRGALLASALMDSNSGAPIICFAQGTRITTPTGTMRVEDLRVGDLVLTQDRGPQPIRWIGSQVLSRANLLANRELRPVLISAGALGENTPSRDLLVSPQHRILLRSKIAQRMFGTAEILVAAKDLLEIDGISRVEDGASVAYFHILFDHHEIVCANGALAESLFTGPEALKTISKSGQDEVRAIFPHLFLDGAFVPPPPAARPIPRGQALRKLISRHKGNQKPMIMAI